MKIQLRGFIVVLVLILSACSSSNNEDSLDTQNNVDNLINMENLVEGKWIDTKGEEQSNEDMYQTQPIGYTSSNEYTLDGNAYVTYYNDNEFLKTDRYSGAVSDLPYTLDEVGEADSIIISFSEQWFDEISLLSE